MTDPARRTSKEIRRTTKIAIEALASHVAGRESFPGMREVAQAMSQGLRKIPEKVGHLVPAPWSPVHREFMASVRDASIFYLWSKTKVAYVMDDFMLAELNRAPVAKIPTQILRRIPDANPFVLLPLPDKSDPEVQHFRTHIGIPVGAIVFGRFNDGEQLCSTKDSHREDLGLMFVGYVDTEEHGTIFQTLRCTIPLRNDKLTVKDTIDATVAKFKFSDEVSMEDKEWLEKWLRRHVTYVFNSLLYTCSNTADIETIESSSTGKQRKSKHARRPRPDDIDLLRKVGFRMGPALFAERKRAEQTPPSQSSESEGGWKQRPHRRPPRWCTYWTGPGKTVPEVIFTKEAYVHMSPDDDAPDVVIRPVRKR